MSEDVKKVMSEFGQAIEEFKKALDRQDNGYGPSYGLPILRSAIALSESKKGWNCSSDDVYVTHGVTEALQIIFASFLKKGDIVFEEGSYTHYGKFVASFESATVPLVSSSTSRLN